MPLLIDDGQRNAAIDYASQHPVQGMDPGFVARFSADYDTMVNANNVNARDLQRANIQSDFINRFYKESGVRVRNWLGGPQLAVFPDREASAKGQFDAWKKDNPDSDLFFPEASFIDNESLKRSQAATQTSQQLQQNSTTWASALGGFAGTAVGALRDPLNAMTAPLAGGAGGVVRTALTEGALASGTQALGTGVAYNYRTQVDPNFGLGEAAYEVAAAGVGGAVLGGGLKGLAGLWERARTGDWPSHVVDAANVVQREASVPANRFEVTPQGKAIYRAAVDKASDDLFAGRPVKLPPETFLQAQARPGRVYDADGRSVGVNYEVVDADSLTTSHTDDMGINPAFPQELQPRDRTRAISQDQVQSIAGNLQPERLGPSTDAANGAPIIGPDNLVESGNGRVMAIRRAYDSSGPSADSYRNYLISQGYDIGDMAKPVLIARRITDLSDADRLNFVTAANRSTAMRLAPAEQALSDGRMIDDGLLDKLQGADVDATSNRDFVRGFMQKLPRAEQSELVDRAGVLSQQGERRVMAALMGRAYGDANLLGRALEDADSNIKAISGALGDSAAPWAKMRDAVSRGQIPKGMDITEDLLDAVRTIMRARDEGQKVGDLVEQAEMFGGPSETAKIIARAMYGDANLSRPISRKRLGAFLDDYATEAMKNDAGPRLFGEPLESGDVLKSALERAGREDLGNSVEPVSRVANPKPGDRLYRKDGIEIKFISRVSDAGENHKIYMLGDGVNLNIDFHVAGNELQVTSLHVTQPVGLTPEESFNAIGTAGMRKILRAYKEMYPEITTVTGERMGGARYGGRYGPNSTDGSGTRVSSAIPDDLTRVAGERLTPEEVEKIAASPETEDAVIQNARKLIADNESAQLGPIGSEPTGREVEPIKIDLGDGRGERTLDEIMQEADDEIAAAKEIESCAIGAPVGEG